MAIWAFDFDGTWIVGSKIDFASLDGALFCLFDFVRLHTSSDCSDSVSMRLIISMTSFS